MTKRPGDKQQLILDFLNQHVSEKGYPPSVREICSAVGLKSTSTVHAYLEKLEKSGAIKKDPTKPRALQVPAAMQHSAAPDSTRSVYPRREMVDVPIVGKVTAGAPILAVENIEDTFPVPVDFTHNGDAFMLRVQGESMIEAGILDKDFVLVRQQQTAQNGDIVVALIGEEATVKTFYKEKGHVRLQPENSTMSPIILTDDLSILGKVVGVFRKLQ